MLLTPILNGFVNQR